MQNTMSNGTVTLNGSNNEVIAQLIPQNWTLSYYPDSSFKGQGPTETSQGDIYNSQLMGKRIFVTNNESAWEVKGSLIKYAVQYSFFCFVKGVDLFPHTTPSQVEFIVIPRGDAGSLSITSFIPLHLEIFRGTTVVWINEDTAPHVIRSTDSTGMITSLFSSNALGTMEYLVINLRIQEYIITMIHSLHGEREQSLSGKTTIKDQYQLFN